MNRDTIPADVRRFILTSISSVPFLEAMLLLWSDPAKLWDSKSLAARLYVNEKRAGELLSDLKNAGFVAEAGENLRQFKFSPSTDELGKMCAKLADAYAVNIVIVTNLVHSNIGKQAQLFADAFKWRKD